MKYSRDQMVQRPFNYAIVDEVDSILIDEARTPLIISGPTDDKSELYMGVDAIVKQFVESDYEKDEKQQSIVLTEEGTEKAERMLETAGLIEGQNLYDIANTQVVHHLNQALKANKMFKRDIDYIVKDGKVVIIDEFTGRMMDGRRWSDGLHQAVEAKEGVQIEPENQTLASITFQNYFRMYPKLSGMTGTAATEAPEFFDIYRMNVVSIPTNVPVQRQRRGRRILQEHHRQVRRHRQGNQGAAGKGPAGPGRHRVDRKVGNAVRISSNKEGIQHSVLNARFHESEAHIVAQAGRIGMVTIATNMAGRGTDIKLGGNLEFRVEDELKDVAEGPERDKAIERIADRDRGREAAGAGGRRPVRARHRAAREPPHRQPAARPFGPSGRPRPVALLPEPRRRSAAHLRPADRLRAPDEQEPGGRRGDHLARGSPRRSRPPRRRSRRATTTSASRSSNSTTS